MTITEHLGTVGRALTAEELSKMLNVHKLTIYRLAERGALPHFRIGTCLRFDPVRVAQWLQSNEIGRSRDPISQ
jgi:excisionase family DNA binding protein